MIEPRQKWMDFVRGVCILLVIFVHTAIATRDWGGLQFSKGFTVFNEFMDPFRMPLLMFLSGLLLHKSLGKSPREYVWGKFCLIFWPFLIWSMLTYAAENRFTLEYIIKTPFSAPSVLWYLWFLSAFYLIALVLTRYRVPLIPVIAICVIASAILPSLLRMDRFAALFAFFLLGHYASSQLLSARIGVAAAIFGLLLALVGGVISVVGESIKYDPLFVWVPLGLITFVLWGSGFYKTIHIFSPLEWIGRNSIVFYVTHFPTLIITARVASSFVEWSGTFLYVVLFLWTICIGSFLQIFREKSSTFAAFFDFRQILKLFNKNPAKSLHAREK